MMIMMIMVVMVVGDNDDHHHHNHSFTHTMHQIIHLSTHSSIYQSIYLSIYPPIIHIYISINLFIYPPINHIYLYIYLSIIQTYSRNANKYDFGQKVGNGFHSDVFLAYDDSYAYAVKVMRPNRFTRGKVLEEVFNMQVLCGGENIIR